MSKKLYRSTTDRVISGVLGGIAEYLDISSSILRILFVALAIFANAFQVVVILYLLGALFIPLNPGSYGQHNYNDNFGASRPEPEFKDALNNDRNRTLVGVALILLGVFFLLNAIFSISVEYLIALLLILAGIYIIFKYDRRGV